MSKISLQSIITNRTAQEYPIFYVGALIDSESGYLFPHLITEKEQLESIFGDFEFKNLYSKLISDNIPCVLLPVITKESKYNVCSLRLSNGFITVSHPKKDKEYEYVSLSNVIENTFVDTDEVTINNPYDNFYPIIGIEVDSDLVKSKVIYSEDSITVKFTEKCTGTITIERFPQIDSNRDEYIIVNHFGKLGTGVSNKFEFKTDDKIIPEIVVTRADEDSRLGERVECNVSISDEPDELGKYLVTVEANPLEAVDSRLRIDVRMIPSSMIVSDIADYQVEIDHGSNRKPIFKIEKDGIESWSSVLYRSKNFAIITIKNPENTIIRYNIITDESKFDTTLLNSGQTTMNLILDFTEVPYSELRYKGSILNPSKYFIIGTVNEDCLIATDEYSQVPTDYYDTDAVYILEDGEGETDENKKNDTLQKFKDWYNDRYSDSCFNLKDLIINYIEDYLDKNELPLLDQFGHQPFVEDWISEFIDKSYIEDFWIASNEKVAKLLTEITKDYSEENIITRDNLLETADLILVNDNNKLVIDFASPIVDKNHYDMSGLKFSSSNNLTQDKLCEFTESDKVVEFYSKIKGSVGTKIRIDIEKVSFYDGLYNITISNNIITENYTVRLYDLGVNTNIENIYFDDITKESQLVEVRLYNYRFSDHVLLDSTYYSEEEYGVPYDPIKVRDNSELVLPTGTFYLDRVTEEEITYDDRINSLTIWKESEWYPDLFIVPKLPDNLEYPKAILDLVEFNEDCDKSIFSQAIINLEYNNLNTEWIGTTTSNLVSANNRVIYTYGDLKLDNEQYPLSLVYIKNIINQTFLDYPSDQFIYDPFKLKAGNAIALYDDLEVYQQTALIKKLNGNLIILESKIITYPDQVTITEIRGNIDTVNQTIILEDGTVYKYTSINELLINNRINFLFYDNLNYYYETIKEQLNQEFQYFIRFISSKYVRESYQIKHNIIGVTGSEVGIWINYVNKRCSSNLSLVTESNYQLETDNDTASVSFEVTVSSIVNKTYLLNFKINI